MTSRKQHGNKYLFFHVVLTLMAMALATATLTTAELSGAQPRTVRFEVRLASHEKVEGWERIPGPAPGKVTIWISSEAYLTNADVAQAWTDRMGNKYFVWVLLTEEGALKLARLTKSHIGESVAVMTDGRVISLPRITAEIINGRVQIEGNFTEEDAGLVAEGITGQ